MSDRLQSVTQLQSIWIWVVLQNWLGFGWGESILLDKPSHQIFFVCKMWSSIWSEVVIEVVGRNFQPIHFGKIFQLMACFATYGNLWHLMKTYINILQLMAFYGTYGNISGIFDILIFDT